VLSFEQYKHLLERKAYAKKYSERVKYKDLVEKWGIAQHHMGSAVYRGIKQYDERIKEEERVNNIRRQIAAGRMEKRNECSTVGLRSNAATADKSCLGEYPQSRAIRGGYSDYIRTEYFEE
jgi:hypothetical protein